MLEPACRDAIARQVHIPQIIVGTLVTGALVFLVIAYVLGGQRVEAGQDGQPIVTYTAVAFAVMALLARLIAANAICARNRQRIIDRTWQAPQPPQYAQDAEGRSAKFLDETGDAGKLFCIFQTKTIVSTALLEGAAFMGAVTYLIEANRIALIVAVAMIVAVAVHFPSRSGVVRWIEGQLRIIEEQRRFAQ